MKLCGVDEAGRGPLAGPVTAAAVILHPDRPITGLRDSKALSEKKRTALAAEIKEKALAWAIAEASVEEIDALNILQATFLAMQRAVAVLSVTPDRILVDGLHTPPFEFPAEAIVKGDQKETCISAASILAKTARDQCLMTLHLRYPEWGFNVHKGYPTAAHRALLMALGPTPIHRRSFGPVRAALGALVCA